MRICRAYDSYLRYFYAKNPALESKSYAEQFETLMLDRYGWADFWGCALRKLGYTCEETISNAEALQRTWAKENSLRHSDQNWRNEIVAAQVRSFAPDVLFVDDHNGFTAEFVRELRQTCRSIRLVLLWCGSRIHNTAIFGECDLVLSNVPELIELIKETNAKVYLLPHCFDPRVLKHIEDSYSKHYNLSFIGSIFEQTGYHTMRLELIRTLMQKSDLVVFSEFVPPSPLSYTKRLLLKKTQILCDNLIRPEFSNRLLSGIPKLRNKLEFVRGLPMLERFSVKHRSRFFPAVFGLEMWQAIRQSKVALNNHIDISTTSASNMRLFEVTGVGTCLLTDWKANLSRFFEIDKEIVTYRSIEECVEKVKWLLENDVEREAIAKAGQLRVLKDHTFDKRALELDQIIKANI